MSNEYPPLVHCLQKRPPQRLGRQPVLKAEAGSERGSPHHYSSAKTSF